MISQDELDVAIARWKAKRDGRDFPEDASGDSVPHAVPLATADDDFDDAGPTPPPQYREVASAASSGAMDEFAGSTPTSEGVAAVPREAYRPDGAPGNFPRAEDEPTVVPPENPAALYDWNADEEEDS